MLKQYYSNYITYGLNLRISYHEVKINDDGAIEVIYNRHYANASSIRDLADSQYAYEFGIYDKIGDLSRSFEKVEFIKVEENIKDGGYHDRAIFKIRDKG